MSHETSYNSLLKWNTFLMGTNANNPTKLVIKRKVVIHPILGSLVLPGLFSSIPTPIQTQEIRTKTTYNYTSSFQWTHYQYLHKLKLIELSSEKRPPSFCNAISSDRTSLGYGVLLSSERGRNNLGLCKNLSPSSNEQKFKESS